LGFKNGGVEEGIRNGSWVFGIHYAFLKTILSSFILTEKKKRENIDGTWSRNGGMWSYFMKLEKRNEIKKALYNSAPILLSMGFLCWPKAPVGTRGWIKIARPRVPFGQCWLHYRRRDLGWRGGFL
jgi:hypothetical protein